MREQNYRGTCSWGSCGGNVRSGWGGRIKEGRCKYGEVWEVEVTLRRFGEARKTISLKRIPQKFDKNSHYVTKLTKSSPRACCLNIYADFSFTHHNAGHAKGNGREIIVSRDVKQLRTFFVFFWSAVDSQSQNSRCQVIDSHFVKNCLRNLLICWPRAACLNQYHYR